MVGGSRGWQEGREGNLLAAASLLDALQRRPQPRLELKGQVNGVGQRERLTSHGIAGRYWRGVVGVRWRLPWRFLYPSWCVAFFGFDFLRWRQGLLRGR